MPIVISHDDVQLLGSLAYQTGREQGGVANQQRVDQLIAQRQQNDLATMQLRTAERQAEADRRAAAYGQRREHEIEDRNYALRQQQVDQQYELGQRRIAASLEAAGIRAQTDIGRSIADDVLRTERDKTLHNYRLQEIAARATARDASGQLISPEGVPSDTLIERQMQQHGNLIPYGSGNAVSAADAARRQKDAQAQAKQLTALPTEQLEDFINKRPDDPWSPYMRAVVQSRRQIEGGTQNTGAMMEGGLPAGVGAPQGPPATLSTGTGLGDLSDAELMELANNPQLMGRVFAQ